MTTEESLALEALILTLLRGFPSSAASVSRGLIDSYVSILGTYSIKSVRQACDRYAHGQVERADDRFAPSAAELAQMARMFDEIAKPALVEQLVVYPIGGEPPPGHVPLGPLEIDHGHGRIDMRGMDHRTKEFVLKHHRLPEPGETKRVGFTPKFQRA
jgi:hypothetical protein